jgi:hypothetical protein
MYIYTPGAAPQEETMPFRPRRQGTTLPREGNRAAAVMRK